MARSFEGHKLRVEGTFFAPDGLHILSVSADSVVRVWEVKTGKCLRKFGDGEILLEKMALSRDGRRVLLGKTNEMQLWDVETGKKLMQFDKPAFSPDGRYALSGEMWGRVRLWELSKGEKSEKQK